MKTGMLTLIAFSHFIWICATVAVLSTVPTIRLAVRRRRRPPAEVIELEQRRRARGR